MRAGQIILLGISAAVVYGVLHDQVTARVCVEYFTIGHPPVFATDDPTLLALGWGLLATWWVGLILGLALAVAARAGPRPRREPRTLVRPVIILLLVSAACALVMGLGGFLMGQCGIFVLVEPLASRVPRERHSLFLADLWAHSTSYAVGFIGGAVVCVRVWLGRRRGNS
jgi:hypothetical protein